MKLLLAAALAIVSFTSQSKADIGVTPIFPVNCDEHDYRWLNRIEDLKKVSESTNEVTFSFKSSVVSCKDKVLTTQLVDPTLVAVGIAKKGLGGLFGQNIIQVSYDALPASTQVTLTVNKNEVFEEDKTERTFWMNYYAWGRFQRYFAWRIVLTKDTASGTCNLQVKMN